MLDITFHITSTLQADCDRDKAQFEAVQKAVYAFKSHNWGDIDEEDKEANDSDYKNRTGHILARYKTPKGDIFISLLFIPKVKDCAVIMYCDEF